MAGQAEPMDTADGPLQQNPSDQPGAPASVEHIASEADLLAFTRLPLEERVLTAQLRGVLAESALTGRIRYKWPLVRPLLDFVLEQVLTAYDADTRVEVGPPGPDSVSETIERFQKLLSAFSDAPWTFQRLCEILLEPRRQYTRLPKLVLAIEKCLLVTTEQPPTEPDQLPPPPLCSTLGPVNVNPPALYTNAHPHGSQGGGGHGGGAPGAADDSATFTHSLLDLRHGPQHHHHVGNHVGTPEHIEEDHWPEGLPEGKGAFKAAGAAAALHGGLRPGAAGHGGSPGAHHDGSPGRTGGGAASPGAAAHGGGAASPGAAAHEAHAHGDSRQAGAEPSGLGAPASPGAAAKPGGDGGDGAGSSAVAEHDGGGGDPTASAASEPRGSEAIAGARSPPASASGARADAAPHMQEPPAGQEQQLGASVSLAAGEAPDAALASGSVLLPAAAAAEASAADADGDIAMEAAQEGAPAAEASGQGPGEPLQSTTGPEGVAADGGMAPMASSDVEGVHVTGPGVPGGSTPPGG